MKDAVPCGLIIETSVDLKARTRIATGMSWPASNVWLRIAYMKFVCPLRVCSQADVRETG